MHAVAPAAEFVPLGHAAHAGSRPATCMNVPVAHGWHTFSPPTISAETTYVPAGHKTFVGAAQPAMAAAAAISAGHAVQAAPRTDGYRPGGHCSQAPEEAEARSPGWHSSEQAVAWEPDEVPGRQAVQLGVAGAGA